jgi:GNAT superfamily N-acetyltransferase
MKPSTMPQPALTIRSGSTHDLATIMAIWHANETIDDPEPPPCPPILPEYPHLLAHGQLWVAEEQGQPIGFAGIAIRSTTAFLTDLFVHPAHHSGGVGAALLQHAFAPYRDLTQFTVSSSDLRALALYTRHGMQPRWPHMLLNTSRVDVAQLDAAAAIAIPAEPHDPMLITWDAQISGRMRPNDHAFWCTAEAGVPLWVTRNGERIGYAYVRQRDPQISTTDLRIGPIGAYTPADSSATIAAAIAWAAPRARSLSLPVPGPHPALAGILRAGFRISYVETFMCAGPACFDETCYCSSGGALF